MTYISIRQRLLKKDSVCRTRATRLRVYFDLWRKRTEERKKRALEERSRDVGGAGECHCEAYYELHVVSELCA